MTSDETNKSLEDLLAKDAIRELVLLYCRGVDRKDFALLRTLYTRDGVDAHGIRYDGSAEGFVDYLETSLAPVEIGAHYVCNHLISVDGDRAEGEVYALGYHILPDGQGGRIEDFAGVRYLDKYRVEDGRWKFASRNVMFDFEHRQPIPARSEAETRTDTDGSYSFLTARVFAAGRRQ